MSDELDTADTIVDDEILGLDPTDTSTAPAHPRSTTTSVAASAAMVLGVVAFAWGFTWLLIGISDGGTAVTIGGAVCMILGAWACVAGFLLFVRKSWAADAVDITFVGAAVGILVFGVLSAAASGAGFGTYMISVILIVAVLFPVALLRRAAARADFPHKGNNRVATTIALWSIVAVWTLPTLGLFNSSFREENAVKGEGWWTVFTDPQLTLENYRTVLSSGGSGDTPDMGQYFMNSLAIVLPATVIPLSVALFAAYAFAWMEFPGRKPLFVFVVSLMAVPLQMSLIPLLQLFNGGAHIGSITIFPDLDLTGTATSVWLVHTGFGLPLAIFLLYNYVSGLPKDLFEAARIDGADHYTIFWRLVVPLSVPALAAFGIFQFLWTWNDYLIALTFIGASNPDAQPLTIRLAGLSGNRGQDWHVLTAAAFVSMSMPLVVFFSLQRYFVRGLLAGSVKG